MESKNEIIELETNHKDAILEVAFDWLGTKMATCSTDQRVKVWIADEDGNWQKQCDFQAHDQTISSVQWAHPDFGVLLATGSFDRCINIWEEVKVNQYSKSLGQEQSSQVGYSRLCSQPTTREAIICIKFSPKHLGLRLAAGTADGYFLLYQPESLMNLANWKLVFSTQVCPNGISCMDWNKHAFDSPTIAIGCFDKENGFPRTLLDQHYQDNQMQIQKTQTNLLRIYIEEKGKWDMLSDLKNPTFIHTRSVNDVAWASLNGRSRHMIATCSEEGIHIWWLHYKHLTRGKAKELLETVKQLGPEGQTERVMKVKWNIIGTVLVSSGSENQLKIWKTDYNQNWECVDKIEDQPMDEDQR